MRLMCKLCENPCILSFEDTDFDIPSLCPWGRDDADWKEVTEIGMIDLKPCPFCGGNNIERLDEFSIGCHDCHLVVKLWGWGFGLPREITGGWNRRVKE